jgi:hypothetical protein
MSFAIPKIQYNNLDLVGSTTNLSADITGISDTSKIIVGMFVKGSGIPTGAKVASVAATSVTLADGLVASVTALDASIFFGYEIEFDYPPKEPRGEIFESNSVTSTSLSGVRQVSTNNIEGNRKLAFSFLTHSIYLTVDLFLQSWALYGKTFRYFEDKTLSTYVEYELDSLKSDAKKITAKGVDQYIWEVPLNLRRVL